MDSKREAPVERPFDKTCDVLIIGAGMAGGLLARQLSLEQPDLRVIVVDHRRPNSTAWVGELTVEVFDDYAVPHLPARALPGR